MLVGGGQWLAEKFMENLRSRHKGVAYFLVEYSVDNNNSLCLSLFMESRQV
ncbi:hypothetical protein NT01EI_3631 [Edwardsiella ictaluri 93-146]|uniref:Uncharacterized protein n=1 Tax=Edwardsiella ictaluri (strain 93-146) TaxID=634503 RepID=C5BGR2_EDWI9|nr:hypothetical protein NT01EI_3631 [Edwardsiella ictaluri 93-146]